MDSNYEVPVSEYWRIIKKRRLTFIAVFLAVVVATVIFTRLQTPVYQATTDLKIERVASLPRDGKIGKDGNGEKDLDVETELRIFKSLGILGKVVEKIEVLPMDPQKRLQALHAHALDYQQRIKVALIPDTMIITITATAESPEKAALLVSAVADVYIAENTHGKKRQMEGVLKYVDHQLVEYRKQLEEVEAQLLKFKQDEKVFEVTPDVKASLDRMTVERTFDFESQMLAIDGELAEVSREIDQKKAGGTLKFLSPEELSENFIFTGLKRRLLQLDFERFLLLIDYTDKHPAVLEKDQIIVDIKQKMVQMIKTYSRIVVTPDMEADLALVLKKLFLQNRREVLYRTINKYYSDAGSLSSNQRDYLKLTRDQERLMSAYNTLLANREETKLALSSMDEQSVSIVSPASAAKDPISPRARVNYLLSVLAGLLMGIVACFFQEGMDTTISTISDVEQKLSLPVLGIIPTFKQEEVPVSSGEGGERVVPRIDALVTFYDPHAVLAQSFKILRTNLLQVLKHGDKKAILFTSSDQQEGKSTLIANVAISMAQLGKKTVLVGLNLRRPSLFKRFGLKREPGVTDIILSKISWQDAMKTPTDILTGGLDIDKLLRMPGLDNLRIITAGHAVDNVSEILNSPLLDELIMDLKKNFDIVLMDCAPTLPVPDAMTIGGRVDGVVIVYKVGKTSRDVLKMTKSRLEHSNATILGVVLNQIKAEEQVGASVYHFREYVEAKAHPFASSRWFKKG